MNSPWQVYPGFVSGKVFLKGKMEGVTIAPRPFQKQLGATPLAHQLEASGGHPAKGQVKDAQD